jgi:hypothetical protein
MPRLRQRPAALWVLCGFYVFPGAAPIVFYVFFAIFPSPGIFPLMGTLTFVALCFTGAALLFNLHKAAVAILAAIIFISVVDRSLQFLTRDETTLKELFGNTLLECGSETLGFLYALQLRKQGVLT